MKELNRPCQGCDLLRVRAVRLVVLSPLFPYAVQTAILAVCVWMTVLCPDPDAHCRCGTSSHSGPHLDLPLGGVGRGRLHRVLSQRPGVLPGVLSGGASSFDVCVAKSAPSTLGAKQLRPASRSWRKASRVTSGVAEGVIAVSSPNSPPWRTKPNTSGRFSGSPPVSAMSGRYGNGAS